MTNEKQNTGRVTQIIGPVIDVIFPEGVDMPEINNALVITGRNGEKLVFEVAKHMEPGVVRAVGLTSTDGIARGIFEVRSRRVE